MSAYPPPPPPPIYDRQMLKQQIRYQKQQARVQRELARAQARSLRPGSIVGPIVLIALGIVFLLVQMGTLSWANAVHWYSRWWPMVLIAAGLVLLAEHLLDQQMRPADAPYRGRVLGGGVVVLLVFLALAGIGSRAVNHAMTWGNHTFGKDFSGFDIALGERHDADDTASSPIADGGSLLIRNPHGDVTVTGASDDGQVHVSVHKEAFARTDSDADEKEQLLQPKFTTEGANLTLEVAPVQGGQADLTVQIPRNTMLTVRADHGDIDIQELHSPVSLSANSGDVNLSGIAGPVTAHINDQHASFSAHSVTGALSLDGHTSDITITDVTGPVSLQGDFFGTTHLERINGTVAFKTSRTQFEAARIDGTFEIALDADLEADQVLGPVKLTTRDRGVSLERVQGSVNIANRNGEVTVTEASPIGDIDIANSKGSVDVGVPANAGFVLNGETRNGDVEDDFGLQKKGTDDHPSLTGTVAGGGPHINIVTSDGDVTVRKATVAPLPPIAPAPHITPAPMPAPAAPKAPRLTAPKPPKSPTPPTAN
jgi:DUF4097 and DUF4098 domain-containing protein YvlB